MNKPIDLYSHYIENINKHKYLEVADEFKIGDITYIVVNDVVEPYSGFNINLGMAFIRYEANIHFGFENLKSHRRKNKIKIISVYDSLYQKYIRSNKLKEIINKIN